MRRHPESSGSRRRITALLSLPVLLLVLTGCFRGEMDITIGTDGNYAVEAQGVTTMPGMVTQEDLDCASFGATGGVGIVDGEGATTTGEDYSEGGAPGCRITANGPLTAMTNSDGSYVVTQNGDVLTFNLVGDPEMTDDEMSEMGLFQPDLTIVIEFPGDVIDGDGGDVSGNRVTFTDGMDRLTNGITVTASATPGGLPGWLLYALIGVGVAVLAIIIVLVVGKGRKKKAAAASAAAYGQQQWGGQQYGQPGQQQWGGQQGQQQWGAPQGQPGQQQWGGQQYGQPGGWDQQSAGSPQQWGATSADQGQGWPGAQQQGWDQGWQGGQQPPQQGGWDGRQQPPQQGQWS